MTVARTSCPRPGPSQLVLVRLFFMMVAQISEDIMREHVHQTLPIAFVLIAIFAGHAQTSQEMRLWTRPKMSTSLVHPAEAWNQHDLDAFMAGYWNSPGLTFFSGGKAESADGRRPSTTIARLIPVQVTRWGTLEFSAFAYRDARASFRFRARRAWHLTMSDGKTPHGIFTLVFRKFPDGWKIIHDHTSAAE